MAAKRYWFKTKKYGWGWGMPLTWQGWASFGVFIAVWLWALAPLLAASRDTNPHASTFVRFAIIMLLDVAALVFVSFKYGEPPKWSWGNKKVPRRTSKK